MSLSFKNTVFIKNILLQVEEYNYGWRRYEDDIKKIYLLEKLNDTWTYGTREYHTEEDIVE